MPGREDRSEKTSREQHRPVVTDHSRRQVLHHGDADRRGACHGQQGPEEIAERGVHEGARDAQSAVARKRVASEGTNSSTQGSIKRWQKLSGEQH